MQQKFLLVSLKACIQLNGYICGYNFVLSTLTLLRHSSITQLGNVS